MKRKNLLFSMLFVLLQVAVFAQGRVVKGTITDSKTKETLPGVTVLVEGTTNATSTNMNGEFTINVDGQGKKLVISSIGYVTQTVSADQDVINVNLESDAKLLSETVVTALGVSREKKTLGYATQELAGSSLSEVKSGNFVNQMSGKVAGMQIKNSGNLGGSTNVIIRGTTSLLFNNQALFVVDGVPINNETTNAAMTNSTQSSGGAGYDYGNPVSDINPDDIESVNVLKGAAATALYGSRAANGVVMITTKKGKTSTSTRPRYGVTLSSNVTVGVVDKSTFPDYQMEYGGGYGPYYGAGPGEFFLNEDVNNDGVLDPNELVVPYTEDASMGGKFDPSLNVYQWDAFVPESKNFGKKTPWVGAGKNGPISFFETAVGYTNSVNVDGGNEAGSFRVSYSNTTQNGILPNSSLKRNNFGFGGTLKLNDRFSASANANYVRTAATGRNSTGYANNELSNFRQWWQTNVNVQDQKEIYESTKANYSWNPASSANPLKPIFWDNAYFQRNESYSSDQRDRMYGNAVLNYKVNEIIGLMGRVTLDQYSTLQEERLATGSVSKVFGTGRSNSSSGYSKFNKNYREMNYDVMANFKKDFGETWSLTGLVGANFRRSYNYSTFASTNGGIVVPKLYSLSNSKENPTAPLEAQETIGVNGFYANASVGFKRYLYLDLTARQDYSSTLPEGKNSFFYPGASLSLLFSELIKERTASWLDFGKVRLNVASVGNDAQFANIKDIYAKPVAFGSVALFSLPNFKNNPELKPEISTTSEIGLEMVFFKRRLGFDFAAYNKNTKDQVVPLTVSTATGYSSKFVNAATLNNKGIELNVYGTPVQTTNFKWTVNVNFGKNVSKVTKLADGIKNIQLANFQGGVTLNASLDEPYGTLKGTDYVYLNGKKVVGANGYYIKTKTNDQILGNITPDFTGGITNTFTYKSWSLSFLVDVQKGGDLFSLDMYYGLATGLYKETVGNNDLGNPKRNFIADGGGVILDGVTETGEVNTKRVEANDYLLNGYATNADKNFIYDASYVKLREVSIAYRVPFKKERFFSNATFSLVGNNLWIIFKNLPNADPEAGLGAGNVQGYQTGVLPTTRNFGFTVTLQF